MDKHETMVETYKHKYEVSARLNTMIIELLARAEQHDNSKLINPEVDIFTKYTPKLKGTTYGSDRYKEYLKEMNVALEHHYKNNRHHPEHFKNGIKDMTLIDVLEMICDWSAAVERHADGDIYKSIEINQNRFEYSDELKEILKNTVKRYL